MSTDDRDKRRHRRLSEDERRLWTGITRSIAPLKRKRIVPHPVESPAAPHQLAPPPRRRAEPPAVRPAMPKPAPALVPLDRRLKQRLARGTEPIAARIDLHGKTQSQAYAALAGFLRRLQAEDARWVLVITGKGTGARELAGERGVLKRQVPEWLRLPELRRYVLAVEPAHRAHGGEGALYVRLRRRTTIKE
jgi:DNA-nicking Smr family endonuclease